MYEEIQIKTPLLSPDGREIYPIVKVSSWIGKWGGMLTVTPCALIINEENAWFFVSLCDEISSVEEMIRNFSSHSHT